MSTITPTPTPTPTAAGPQNLRDRLNRLLNNGITQLNEAGRADLARSVTEEVRRGSQLHPTVVVAGENNRGKSTLINALLRHPELAPTGPTATTGTFVRFHYAPSPTAVVHLAGVHLAGEAAELREIPLGDLADWISIEGRAASERRVLGAEVGIAAEMLKSVDLVDTPGVGGLDSAQGILALEAITKADAMIFVVDASAPLSAPELGFLVQAARRIDTIVVAVTKIDAYRGAQRIVADDTALLRQYAPELGKVTVVGVSPASYLAAGALERDRHGAQLQRLRTESGVDALEVALRRRIVERSANLSLANTMQTLRSGLEVLVATADAAHEAAHQANPAVAARLHGERQRLAELEADSAQWRQRLNSDLAKIRNEYATELARRFRALSRRYEEQIERAGRPERQRMTEQLEQDLMAVAGELADMVSTRLADVAHDLLGSIDAGSTLDETMAELARLHTVAGRSTVTPGARTTLTRVEKLSSLVSFSSGRALGSLGATLPFTGGLGLPVVGIGLGVGALFSLVMTKARREAREQTNFRAWLKDVVVETQASLGSAFAHQMIDVQDELTRALSSYIAERKRTAAAVLKAAEASLPAIGQASPQDRSEDEASRQSLKQLVAECRHFQALTGSDRAETHPERIAR